MLDLRLSVTAPLVCLLACTPIGDPGDNHDATAPDDTSGSSGAGELVDAGPARRDPSPRPLQGGAVPAALPVDDSARCDESAAAAEAAPIDPQAAVLEGRMAVQQGDAWLGLPLRETRYDTVVVGNLAETSVVQVFHNPLPDRLEALYNFPLPTDAAVDDYAIRVGGREIRGVMQTRDDARKTYEAARDAGRSAALLEQHRPNLFAQAVANIPPGGTIEVEMHLVQPLRREGGRYGLVLPITVGPRYNPGHPIDAAATASPVLPKGVVSCSKVDIQVTIEAGFPVTELRSKYHALQVEQAGDITRLELARGPARPNRDFDLSWQLAGLEPRARLMAQKTGKDGGHFTLTIEPPQAYPQEKARARELVFALDTSGSMRGAPMETAVAAVQKALAGMGPADTFQIIRFAGDASQMAPAPLPNTAANRKRAAEFLRDFSGDGGTEMLAGITAALARPEDPERMRMVLFLTDGYIGNESEIFAAIARQRGQARLFGLGVGSSVNHFLLDGMSRMGRGSAVYVGPGEATDAVVERFYGYIGRPVLTDIEIDWGGLPVADVVPGALPDLFAGQPVVVYGRFTGKPAGQAKLKAKLGGAAIEMPLELDFASSASHDGLASMWARQQIDALLGYPHLSSPGVDDKTIAQVTKLAIAHRVMTEYTSFVAVETRQEQQKDGTLKTIRVPLERPLGVENSAGEGTIGLGNTGLIGRGGGSGHGYGSGSGFGFGGRGTRVPTVRQAQVEVYGSIDKDIIRRIVRAHINELRHCYEQALARDPGAKGRVAIRFTITTSGAVRTAELADNTFTDPQVGACIVTAVKKWSFPKLPSEATITYPFLFEPG